MMLMMLLWRWIARMGVVDRRIDEDVCGIPFQ